MEREKNYNKNGQKMLEQYTAGKMMVKSIIKQQKIAAKNWNIFLMMT
jgi:hypothetical protein